MKNKKLLLVVPLLSLTTLAGCSLRTPSDLVEPSTPPASSTTSSEDPDIATDIFSNPLPGLNVENENTYDFSDCVHSYVVGNVAYGWVQYESWGNQYGVAVKVTFDSNNKALALQIGAPGENVHNFTPSWAAGDGKDYYPEYLANLQGNMEKLILGKTDYAITDALKTVTVDPEESNYTAVDTIIAHATQTNARTEIAVLAASVAHLIERDAINTNVIDEVSDYLDENNLKPTSNSTSVTASGFQSSTDSSIYYGFSVYMSWSSIYGVAIKAKVENKVIKEIEVGVPCEGAHNFTPMYAVSTGGVQAYVNYVDTYEETLSKALVGKELTKDMFDDASYDLAGNKYDEGTAFGEIGAGETQSYARAGLAANALVDVILG